MSQTTPVTKTHHQEEEVTFVGKGAAFVSVYNDGDISEYLYTTPAFASGFLPLEPEEGKQHATPVNIKPTRRPTETFNTGTTPPSTAAAEKTATDLPTSVKSAMKTQKAAKVVERRPSFIEVTMPHVHHTHEHEHKAHDEHRRHSSESHLPMGWWPQPEEKAKHEWEEEDEADEEEDVIEEAFYASYD